MAAIDYHRLTDVELTSLLKAGDHQAFAEIHKRYYPLLYAHAFKRLPEREEIADILQELFAFIWSNRESLYFTSGLSAYLYTSVRNRVMNVFSKNKIRREYAGSLSAFAAVEGAEADEHLRYKELVSLIEREVAGLPEKMREVFELSRFQHLSHVEIAEIMGTSPLTVRKQIQNVLKVLRTKLSSAVFYIIF